MEPAQVARGSAINCRGVRSAACHSLEQTGGFRMNARHAALSLVVVMLATAAHAQQKAGPLTIESQGSFFVGGEVKPAPPSVLASSGPAEITVNQMYVQFQRPLNAERHAPVVMVHGCCLSS